MDLEDVIENPAFWILTGLAITAETIGFIISRKSGLDAFPLWQFLILVAGTIIISAVIAGRD